MLNTETCKSLDAQDQTKENPETRTQPFLVLKQLFGVPFDYFIEQNGWHDWLAMESGNFGNPIRWDLFEQISKTNTPLVLEVADKTHLVLIPIEHEYQRIIGAATIETGEPDWVRRLAGLSTDLVQKHSDLSELTDVNDSFVRQVSHNLEELTFLRQVSEHLRLADANTNLLTLSEQLITLLNRTVRAEQILLVSDKEFTFIGESVIDRLQVDQLISRFGSRIDQPIIVNNFDTQSDPTLESVSNFVLAPLEKSGQIRGWLVAINRVPLAANNNPSRWDEHNHEFGTCEATLLASAAPMLVTHMVNTELFKQKERLLTEVVCSLVSAIEAKDKYTRGHSERVALYGKCLAKKADLNVADQERIYLSGLLHDIGKIAISDKTLSKPSKPTDEEFEEIKRHPEEGWAILNQVFQLNEILPGVLHHHERIDGKGYPDRLNGNAIPVDGRILAVADAFDAMTSDRPYRNGMSVGKAVEILKEGAGTQWDTELIHEFLDVIDEIVEIKNAYKPKSRTPRNVQE